MLYYHSTVVLLPSGHTEVFSATSADRLMLELHEDENGFCDVADSGRAEHDVLQGAQGARHGFSC
jgi:hypothetical protein